VAIAGGCGTAPCPATVDTTVDGQASHTWGHGYIVPGGGGATSFVVTAGSSARLGHPRLHPAGAGLRAPRAVPSPGTYIISDQVDLNGTYEPNVDTLFVLTDGSIQIGSISPTRAQGSFTFQGLMSSPPTATVTITSGTFDVPVQAP